MARALTPAMLAAIATGVVRPAFFYEGEFSGGTVYLFTGHGTLVWDGKTWTGDNGLMRINSMSEAGDLSAVNFTVGLSGEVSSLLTLALSQVRRGLPGKVWLGLFAQDAYLSLPGVAGNYASTPDAAANSITGDIDIRVKLSLDDWTPAAPQTLLAKWDGAGRRSYAFWIATDGKLQFSWAGGGGVSDLGPLSSTVAVGVADQTVRAVRIAFDVDNGASGADAKFYVSSDGFTWTQLGATVTHGSIANLFDGVGILSIGQIDTAGAPALVTAGHVYRAEVRNGIDGPVVAGFDARRFAGAALTAEAETGEVWTIAQSGGTPARIVQVGDALIADPFLCFAGRADKPDIVPDPQSCSVSVAYESRLIDAARRRERRYTSEDQQIDYPGDLGFDYVPSLQDRVITWGRR